MTTDTQKPDALHLANELDSVVPIDAEQEASLDAAAATLRSQHAEIETLHQAEAVGRQLLKAHADRIRELEAELKGAQADVAIRDEQLTARSESIIEGRWYSVAKDGQVTLCLNAEDARDTAAEAAQTWPSLAPYVAVQLAPIDGMIPRPAPSGHQFHTAGSGTLRGAWEQGWNDCFDHHFAIHAAISQEGGK